MIADSPGADDLSRSLGDAAAGDAATRLPGDECWRKIGVNGDRSCPELATHIHCRNCPVMAAAARMFFDRAAPEGYLSGWVGILEESSTSAEANLESLLVFRLGDEWFALPTGVLVEVTTPRPCHRIPHRIDGILEGIVNIRGQLQLCVSAWRLLGIEGGDQPPTDSASGDTPRMLAVERHPGNAGDRWVFRVDHVAGVHRVERQSLRMVPSTVSQSGARFCRALFDWEDHVVGILDENRLFDRVEERLSTH